MDVPSQCKYLNSHFYRYYNSSIFHVDTPKLEGMAGALVYVVSPANSLIYIYIYIYISSVSRTVYMLSTKHRHTMGNKLLEYAFVVFAHPVVIVI